MPNVGALTTTFTPAPSCSSYAGYTESVDDDNDTYYLQGPIATAGCFPEGYNPNHDYFFSPAAACPSGYSVACQTVNSVGTATETVRTCCPTVAKYTCQGTSDQARFTWHSSLGCASDIFGTVTLAPITHVDHANTTVFPSTVQHRGGVGAQAVIVHFQSSDLAQFTASASPSSSATSGQPPATSAATSSGSGSGSSSQPTQTVAPSSGLSTGAAAGIGAGCGILGAALIGIGAFLLWRRRHNARNSAAGPAVDSPPQKYHNIELTNNGHPMSSSPASAYTGYSHSHSATNSSAVGTQHMGFASPSSGTAYTGEHPGMPASNRALSPQELSSERPYELSGR